MRVPSRSHGEPLLGLWVHLDPLAADALHLNPVVRLGTDSWVGTVGFALAAGSGPPLHSFVRVLRIVLPQHSNSSQEFTTAHRLRLWPVDRDRWRNRNGPPANSSSRQATGAVRWPHALNDDELLVAYPLTAHGTAFEAGNVRHDPPGSRRPFEAEP